MKKKTTSSPAAELRAYALDFPGAHEDFPWGERVMKVGKKVFVFLGRDDEDKKKVVSPAKREHIGEPGEYGICVKLSVSLKTALARPYAKPADYGLGPKGWVGFTFRPGDEPPMDDLKRWIAESYRAVAPKKLIKELDLRSPGV
jgi:predicted DNA-binding protein (MmcQ/YjbR family)